VDLERLTDLSRGLSRLLDAEPALQDSYQLEVTSPGLERSLRRPAHFQKSLGREVVVKATGEESKYTHRGVLASAGEREFTIESEDGPVTVGYDDVISAKTVFRWEKAPKPGH
jgi:ribosome maturation factor RimP